MQHTKVYLADAGSTDGTQDVAKSYSDRLAIEVIPGGLPSVGRNAGAKRAVSEYILFLDADMELRDPTLVRRAVALARRRKLYCVTTNIWCNNGNLRDHSLFICNNLAQYGSIMAKPFSTGMFMLFNAGEFHRLGGFNERALYAEDYMLTKQVKSRKFGIVRGRVFTSNRRFRSMGHLAIVRMFVKTVFNTFDDDYFLRDQGYWKVPVR
jgi:glycosyltransferase involved in cell wall biosynthesis